jgi:hypothetical protein
MPLFSQTPGKLLVSSGKLRGCCCSPPIECICCSTEPPELIDIVFPGGGPTVPIYLFYSDGNWDDVIAGLPSSACWFGSDLFALECINEEETETVSNVSLLLVMECGEDETTLKIYVREFLEGEAEYTNYGYYQDSRPHSAPLDCGDYFSTIFPVNSYDFIANIEGELCLAGDYPQLNVVPG